MSIADNGPTGRSVKTLAIRLEPELHAQLSLVAQLRGSTITDEIRSAIEAHISSLKANPDLAGQAESVLEDIEREAAARRAAIATLFGGEPPTKSSGSSRSRGRKATGEGSSDG
ncbi:MAG TPA: hypothetical protein VFH54_15205 [Mycobacteriales bacterium]|nr:hypothetical protein [Mycobacteriales bacterium]